MQSNNKAVNNSSPEQQISFYNLIVRLYWMIFGYFPFVIITNYIVSKGYRGISASDLFYLLGISLLISAKYADVKYLKGRTADNKRESTMKDFRTYTLLLLLAFVILRVIIYIR